MLQLLRSASHSLPAGWISFTDDADGDDDDDNDDGDIFKYL